MNTILYDGTETHAWYLYKHKRPKKNRNKSWVRERKEWERLPLYGHDGGNADPIQVVCGDNFWLWKVLENINFLYQGTRRT